MQSNQTHTYIKTRDNNRQGPLGEKQVIETRAKGTKHQAKQNESGGTRKVKADRQANGVTPMTQGEEKEDAWGTLITLS